MNENIPESKNCPSQLLNTHQLRKNSKRSQNNNNEPMETPNNIPIISHCETKCVKKKNYYVIQSSEVEKTTITAILQEH